jgi:hypothetical protein
MPSLRRPLFLLKQTFGLLPLSALERNRSRGRGGEGRLDGPRD